MSIALLTAKTKEGESLYRNFDRRYSLCSLSDAEWIVVCGGDGMMLHAIDTFLHESPSSFPAFYGMHTSLSPPSKGFLMNPFSFDALPDRLEQARKTKLPLLQINAQLVEQSPYHAFAVNDVSILRKTSQAAHIKVSINDKVKIESLVADGILLATPAGSTGYNRSLNGPIIPIGNDLVTLMPINSFYPRSWRGSLLSSKTLIRWDILEQEKRPLSLVTDFRQKEDVSSVEISVSQERYATLLFDQTNLLEQKIIQEQFHAD